MNKFRKKPVVIHAVQWDGNMTTLDPLWEHADPQWEVEQSLLDPALVIRTLEGDMRANVGDWIICGVNGELYPCKPDIFEKTYEPMEEAADER